MDLETEKANPMQVDRPIIVNEFTSRANVVGLQLPGSSVKKAHTQGLCVSLKGLLCPHL